VFYVPSRLSAAIGRGAVKATEGRHYLGVARSGKPLGAVRVRDGQEVETKVKRDAWHAVASGIFF
jgi:hypothetical protein